MKPSFDRNNVPRRSRYAPVALGVAMLTTAFACSPDKETLFFGSGDGDASTPTSLTAPASDADVDAARPGDEVAMCVATECPAPFATCSVYGTLPPYQCSTNLSTDPDNCGECGHACPYGAGAYHYLRNCQNGACIPLCQDGYSDCNGVPEDGCESDPKTDSKNCGICGNACADGVACIDGKCGCPPGTTSCGGTCIDTSSDDANCGACGFSCADNQPTDAGDAPTNMFFGCHQGQCRTLRCYHDDSVFWADCNGDKGDGCEVDLAQPNSENCGKCGNACDSAQQCFWTHKTGMDCQCKNGKHLCPTDSTCVDLESDPTNCGSCGYYCPGANNADVTCNHGRCGFICQPGHADCNGRSDDGCEVDLRFDPRSCGSCGTTCDVAAGQPCVDSRCLTKACDTDGGPVR